MHVLPAGHGAPVAPHGLVQYPPGAGKHSCPAAHVLRKFAGSGLHASPTLPPITAGAAADPAPPGAAPGAAAADSPAGAAPGPPGPGFPGDEHAHATAIRPARTAIRMPKQRTPRRSVTGIPIGIPRTKPRSRSDVESEDARHFISMNVIEISTDPAPAGQEFVGPHQTTHL